MGGVSSGRANGTPSTGQVPTQLSPVKKTRAHAPELHGRVAIAGKRGGSRRGGRDGIVVVALPLAGRIKCQPRLRASDTKFLTHHRHGDEFVHITYRERPQ